jgi:hypothetical protein
VQGTYQYRSTLPDQGLVVGSIEVGAEGPLSVTSNVGPCRDPNAHTYRRWFRERSFAYPGHTVRVELGHAGQPPIGGTVSNERTTILRSYSVNTTCRTYETTPSGDETCVAWNREQITERRTTGGTGRFSVVRDSVAQRP